MEKILSILTILELIAMAMFFLSLIYILITTRRFFAFYLAGMLGIVVVFLAAIVCALINSINAYAIIIMVYSVVAAGFFGRKELRENFDI